MNRRLFWKIFLPFWVAQALLLGALYLRVHYRISSEHPWWIQPERREMPVLADLRRMRYEEAWPAGGCRQLLDQSVAAPPLDATGWSMPTAASFPAVRFPDRILHGAPAAEKNEGLYHSFEANVLAARDHYTARDNIC